MPLKIFNFAIHGDKAQLGSEVNMLAVEKTFSDLGNASVLKESVSYSPLAEGIDPYDYSTVAGLKVKGFVVAETADRANVLISSYLRSIQDGV